MIRATESAQSVRHTFVVKLELSELLSTVKDVETGPRGFVITGDASYLVPYELAVQEIEHRLSRLRVLTQAKPQQQKTIDQIEFLVNQRLVFTREVIDVRSAQGFEAAQQLVRTDRGKQIMDELRIYIARAQNDEDKLLERRINTTKVITGRLTSLLLIGGILSWLIVIVAFCLLVKENRSRRKAHQQAVLNEQQFRTLFQLAGAGNAEIDALTGQYLRVNQKFCDITGYSADELRGHRFSDITHPDDRQRDWDLFEQAKRVKTQHISEKRYVRKDGTVRWVHVIASIIYDNEDRPVTAIASFFDITDRKAWETQIQRLNRTLRAISDSSQAMLYAQNEKAYLQEVCDIIVRDCGHTLVWIGYAEDDSDKTIRPVAYSGFEVAYLEIQKMTWADNALGQNPMAEAIRTQTFSMCKNLRTDPCFGPWREQALKRGYESAIVFPITAQNKTFGILMIYSMEPDPFGPDEIELIGELTIDLAFGITALRSKAEQEKAQAIQQHFRALFESAPGLYLVLEPEDFRIAAASDAYLRATMTERHEIVGKTLFEVFPDEPDNPNADGVRNLKASFLHVKASIQAEVMPVQRYPIRRPDGSWEERWWSVINSPVVGPDDRIAYIIHRVEDITAYILQMERQGQGIEALNQIEVLQQHMQAEIVMRARDLQILNERLRESEEKFRMLAENAQAAIGIVQGMQMIYANPYLVSLSGYTLEELMQIDLIRLIHPEYRDIVLERARKRQAGEPVESHYEFVMVTRSGESRWLDFSPVAINYHGHPAIVGIAFDVTERRQYQQQLEEITGKLDAQTKELEAIIGVVSHDLRAPLVNVQGFSGEIQTECRTALELASSEGLPPEVRKTLVLLLSKTIPESLTFIQSSAEAMNNLVRSLVEVAKAGLATSKPETLDMNAIVRNIVSTLEFKIKQTNADVSVPDLPPCHADRQQVTQIFTNLLDNAVKYLDPGRAGMICISGQTVGDHAIYCIADNGVGIDPENQEKVFQLFTRFSAKLAAGEGLGLAMSKRLADKNNGKITLESEKDRGSMFCITLPRPPC